MRSATVSWDVDFSGHATIVAKVRIRRIRRRCRQQSLALPLLPLLLPLPLLRSLGCYACSHTHYRCFALLCVALLCSALLVASPPPHPPPTHPTQRAKVEAEVARRRALLEPATRDLAANAAFALLAIDALFDVLKPAALAVMGGGSGGGGGGGGVGDPLAKAIADSATYAMYKDALDRMTAGSGGGGGGGGEKKRRGGGGGASSNPYGDGDDDGDDDDDDGDDVPLPPLVVSRAAYLEVIGRLGVGRTPASLKLLNRVFSAFDPEVSFWFGGESERVLLACVPACLPYRLLPVC